MTAAWIADNSALAAFRESPELFRLKYRLHLQPATPDEPKLCGSALHAGINARHLGAPLDRMIAVARQIRGESGTRRTAEQVERILRAYEARYPRDGEPFTVVMTEEYTEARMHSAECMAEQLRGERGALCRGTAGFFCFDFCGIIDGGIRFPDGSEYILDLKSTGAYLNEQWQTTMSLADQFVGYVALRRALGHRCDGFMVDGIHVKDYVKKGDTSPTVDGEKDFARVGPVRVQDWQIERWAASTRYTLAQIAELERTRGIDTPWPIYQNWAYGKVDAYREFYETPPELHAQVAKQFERREWNPREEAAKRVVML